MGFDEEPTASGRDCDITSDFGSIGPISTVTARVYDETTMPGKIVQLTGTIDVDLSLRVELWDGYGVFAGGSSHTGTFDLAGDEISAASCGVCVYLSLRTTPVGSDSSTYVTLLATSGIVDVTQLGGAGSDIEASVAGLELAELDTTSSARVEGGCTSVLDDASLNATAQSTDNGITRGGHDGDGASGSGGDGD